MYFSIPRLETNIFISPMKTFIAHIARIARKHSSFVYNTKINFPFLYYKFCSIKQNGSLYSISRDHIISQLN
jgi:hypothetical protein